MLAAVEAIRHLSPHLYGREFTFFTDHKPLCALMTLDHLNERLKRFSMKLQPWMVQFVYLPAKDNTLADALSRQDFRDKDQKIKTSTTSCPSLAAGDVWD